MGELTYKEKLNLIKDKKKEIKLKGKVKGKYENRSEVWQTMADDIEIKMEELSDEIDELQASKVWGERAKSARYSVTNLESHVSLFKESYKKIGEIERPSEKMYREHKRITTGCKTAMIKYFNALF